MIAQLLAALALLAAQAASPDEVGGKSEPRDRRALQAFGACLVSERSQEARALLAVDYRHRDYGEAMRKLIRRDVRCPGIPVPRGAYRSGSLLWGGAFSEALLRRDRAIDQLGARTAYRPELPAIEARNAGELMAFCVIRRDPERTAALLRTEVASAEEYTAIVALGPTLSACVPANSKSNFTREALRALIGIGAYRLYVHNLGAVQEAAK